MRRASFSISGIFASLAAPALAFSAALLLGGCVFDTKVAGGAEDFPNTIASLGVTASQNLGDQAEWDQFSNLPAVSLQDADSMVAGPRAKAAAGEGSPMAKTSGTAGSRASQAADTTYDLADSATSGIGRRIIHDENLFRLITDTTTFRWDDKARDSIRGNELVLDSRGGELRKGAFGLLKAYRFENTDSSGGFDRGTFYERDPRANGTVHHKLHIVRPGPDGDFSTKADNVPVYFGTAKMLGADTLDAFDISDADGDGRLWGEHDSGLVHVRQLQTDPALRPSVARFSQAMKAVCFKQGGRTYPVAYIENRTEKNGRKVTFAVKGPRTDSAFGPGDTVDVVVHTVASPDEDARFSEKTSRFRILLSPTPLQFSGNLLLRYTMETRWRDGAFKKGLITATRFTFTPDEPVASGTLTVKGSVLIEAEFADGTTGSATGTFHDRRIEVDLQELKDGLKVRRFRVHWDAADGRVLRQERLPD